MKFADLNLHPEILTAIEKLGFEDCTPIQESAMPGILEGKDIAGLAQTGTGKTAAFVVPLLDRLIRSKSLPSTSGDQAPPEIDEQMQKRIFPDWKAKEFILILVPTRELVDQVKIEVEKLRGNYPASVLAIYGGTGYDKQLDGLKTGVDFIVGTPGRLIDLYKTHAVDFRQVRAIVFDEADRMFDMGFRDDMKFILRRVPKTRQFLVFSATLNFEVINIAYMFGAEPIECNVSRDQAKAENVKDELFQCGHLEKPQFLLSALKRENPKQVIIFSNFKHNVERIAHFLNENGYPAVAISSLLTQSQRNRVIDQFKAENHLNILVATDLAARGLDIKGVDLIINYELPDDPENYVHRIGRTGRAGEEGRAISLVSDRDVEALQRIEEYLKHKVTMGWLEDSQLVKDFKPFPQGEGRPRSQAPSGEGRRPQFSREPRRERSNGPGDFRRPNSQRPAPKQPQQQTPERQQGQQHRDRKLGRHGGHSEVRADRVHGESRPAEARHGENRKPEGRKFDPRRRDHHRRDPSDNRQRNFDQRRPNYDKNKKFSKPAAPAPSLGQKISGFIKGLFGR